MHKDFKMAIPLPKIIPDVEPGGQVLSGMNRINALTNLMHEAEYNRARAQYAPTTMMAEAASKLAYANLMGPQFLAKMLADTGIKASLNEGQLANAINTTYRAGSRQGTGNAFLNMPGAQGALAPQKRFSFTNWLQDKFRNKIESPQAPMNALNAPIQSQRNAINAPAQQEENANPIISGGNENIPPDVNPENLNGNNPDVFKLAEAYQASPEGQAMIEKTGNPNYLPETTQELVDWAKREQAKAQKSYAEKEAEYHKIQSEGKEEGKIRAVQRKELDDDVKQAIKVSGPLKHLGEILKNPKFQNARRLPGFQKLQLDAKAQIGSKEEQEIIGDFQTTALEVVAATVMGFGGRILDKEIGLSNDMKLAPKDTIDSMIGKYPSIVAFKEMTKQRSSIASKLMNQDKSLTLTEAFEKADKKVDGEKIRARVKKELKAKPAEQPITEDDITSTMKARNMTREQVIKRLKEEGRYNG